MDTRKIRKQVYELSIADFSRFPVWEFALDEEGEEGQDEATVRPCQRCSDLHPLEGMFVVRASFVLADGTQMQGYLTPASARKCESRHPSTRYHLSRGSSQLLVRNVCAECGTSFYELPAAGQSFIVAGIPGPLQIGRPTTVRLGAR
jgi:hypothetical protein